MSKYRHYKKDSLVEFLLKILLNAKYERFELISDDLSGYFSQKRIIFEIEQLEVQLSFSKHFRANKRYRELVPLLELLLKELGGKCKREVKIFV